LIDQASSQAAPPRLLVAADPTIDPHRLVTICSDHSGGGAASVSLLVPVDLESKRSSASAERAEGLLRPATALLDAAGFRVEDIALAADEADVVELLVGSGGFDALLVCPARRRHSSPVLCLAVRVARTQGLEVDGDTSRCARGQSRLRRVAGALLPWRLRRV
jgi:hypothetical protein